MFRNGQGANCGLDRVGKPDDLRGLGIRRHTSPANHRIPHLLDAFRRKKIRRRIFQRLPFGPVLMARTAPKVDIFAVRAIIVATASAAKVIDRLAGKALRRKSRSGDDDLAMFVPVSGICGLKSRHRYSRTACCKL